MNYNEKLEYALSDLDIKRQLASFDVRLIEYPDLKNYETISDLLPHEKCAVVILVQIKTKHMGHWVCLTRNRNIIYLFDSLGYRPDKNLTWTPKNLRTRLGQDTPYLTYLLNGALDSNFKVWFNSNQYQKSSKGISTCGRHVIFFLKWFFTNQITSGTAYLKYMNSLIKKLDLSPDNIVVKYTEP